MQQGVQTEKRKPGKAEERKDFWCLALWTVRAGWRREKKAVTSSFKVCVGEDNEMKSQKETRKVWKLHLKQCCYKETW